MTSLDAHFSTEKSCRAQDSLWRRRSHGKLAPTVGCSTGGAPLYTRSWLMRAIDRRNRLAWRAATASSSLGGGTADRPVPLFSADASRLVSRRPDSRTAMEFVRARASDVHERRGVRRTAALSARCCCLAWMHGMMPSSGASQLGRLGAHVPSSSRFFVLASDARRAASASRHCDDNPAEAQSHFVRGALAPAAAPRDTIAFCSVDSTTRSQLGARALLVLP